MMLNGSENCFLCGPAVLQQQDLGHTNPVCLMCVCVCVSLKCVHTGAKTISLSNAVPFPNKFRLQLIPSFARNSEKNSKCNVLTSRSSRANLATCTPVEAWSNQVAYLRVYFPKRVVPFQNHLFVFLKIAWETLFLWGQNSHTQKIGGHTCTWLQGNMYPYHNVCIYIYTYKYIV